MKTHWNARPWRVIVIVAPCALLAACSGTPQIGPEPAEEDVNTIAYLKELCRRGPQHIDRDLWIRGGIVSNDRQGNFYKSIVVEDSTGGIEVKLDLEKIYLTEALRYGRTVIIHCNGLTLGAYGGALQLGEAPTGAWETDPIPAERIFSHIVSVDGPQEQPTIHYLDMGAIPARYVNCWVRFEDVQFIDEEIPGLWGESGQDIDRHLVSRQCDTLRVRVRAQSLIAEASLPEGSGDIEGVLGYFNGKYELRPTTFSKNSMTKARFTPKAD